MGAIIKLLVMWSVGRARAISKVAPSVRQSRGRLLSTNVASEPAKPSSPPQAKPARKGLKRLGALVVLTGGSVALGKYLDENRPLRSQIVTQGGQAGELFTNALLSSYHVYSDDVVPTFKAIRAAVEGKQSAVATREPSTASSTPDESPRGFDQTLAPTFRVPQKSSSSSPQPKQPEASTPATSPAPSSVAAPVPQTIGEPVQDEREMLIEKNRLALERQAKALQAQFEKKLAETKAEAEKEADVKVQASLKVLRDELEKQREESVAAAVIGSTTAFNEERAETFGQLEHLRVLAVKAESALDTAVEYHQQGHSAHLLALALENVDAALNGRIKFNACLDRIQRVSPEMASAVAVAVRGDARK
eukprot:c6150_g1_i2.p1 GENE.c6150_g1_i2~~c6150_g1_i2.p1  ORF type:complete len:363 (-),score=79.07 c6150_g1_i2:136-1224(-)